MRTQALASSPHTSQRNAIIPPPPSLANQNKLLSMVGANSCNVENIQINILITLFSMLDTLFTNLAMPG